MSWTALCQPSTPEILIPSNSRELTYCLPIGKARRLVEDAFRLRIADSLNNVLSARIDLLNTVRKKESDSYTNLLKLSEQKFETQKEITADFVRLADSWREESEYYQRKYKKQRRQKGVLTIGAVGLLVIMILK